jgi:hypothetical protein
MEKQPAVLSRCLKHKNQVSSSSRCMRAGRVTRACQV